MLYRLEGDCEQWGQRLTTDCLPARSEVRRVRRWGAVEHAPCPFDKDYFSVRAQTPSQSSGGGFSRKCCTRLRNNFVGSSAGSMAEQAVKWNWA
jgi:hypothetical protein